MSLAPTRPTRRRRAHVALGMALAAATVVTSTQVSITSAEATTLRTVTARPADGLNRMSGVNTRMLISDSPYGNFTRTRNDLEALGVRRVREYFAPSRQDHHDRLNALAARGIKSTVVLDTTPDRAAIAGRLDVLARKVPRAVDGIEPPNEWNNKGGADWAAEMRAYQRALFPAVNARPALNGAHVLGPSLARRQGYQELGYLGDVLDLGNVHLYAGGDVPSRRIDEQLANERIVAGDKRVAVTEMGYHNALRTTSTHPPTSEPAAAQYVPRLFLEYFRRGVPRAFSYELYDHLRDNTASGTGYFEAHFGLARFDGTRKPAFNALANLLDLTSDPGPAFTPGRLTYSVEANQKINQVLVQRRDRSFVLLLWRDVKVWDQFDRRSIDVAPISVKVAITTPMRRADVHRPTAGALPRFSVSSPTTFTTPMAGDVTAIVLTPPI